MVLLQADPKIGFAVHDAEIRIEIAIPVIVPPGRPHSVSHQALVGRALEFAPFIEQQRVGSIGVGAEQIGVPVLVQVGEGAVHTVAVQLRGGLLPNKASALVEEDSAGVGVAGGKDVVVRALEQGA